MKLDDITVSKPVKVKELDSCEQITDNSYSIKGTVARDEARLLDNVLQLFRRKVGSLSAEELQLVSAMLMLRPNKNEQR